MHKHYSFKYISNIVEMTPLEMISLFVVLWISPDVGMDVIDMAMDTIICEGLVTLCNDLGVTCSNDF